MDRFSERIRLVTPETVARLINGEFRDVFDNHVIVDCRFPFEFNGGHIFGAINKFTKEHVLHAFIGNRQVLPIVDHRHTDRVAIVFHCEFSSVRAPTQYEFLRYVLPRRSAFF